MRLSNQLRRQARGIFLLAVLFCFLSPSLYGVTWDAGTLNGVMVQPTSNYYHMVYGAYVGMQTESEKLGWQAGYLERPLFKDEGFADKEWSYYAVLGSKLVETSSKTFGVWGGVGWSRVSGYIKPLANAAEEAAALPERDFLIDGPAADLELYLRWHAVRLSLAHQTFVGFASAMQTSAYVAWPYNFLMLKLGTSF